MTSLVVVCTGRNTHPQSTADVADIPMAGHSPDPADPAMSMGEAILDSVGRPRRKRLSPGAEYRCPVCGQRRRLGNRRISRLLSVNSAIDDAEVALYGRPLPVWVPVDISYM